MLGKIHVDATRRLALTRMRDEVESVEWINTFLQRFWVQLEPKLSEQLKDTISSTLASSKPAFLDDLLLSVFTLGSSGCFEKSLLYFYSFWLKSFVLFNSGAPY